MTLTSCCVTACIPPSISVQPADQATFAGAGTAVFTVTASNAVSYQWQVSTDAGTTWGNVTDGGVYTGSLTASLTITNPPIGMNNYRYRVIVTGSCTPTVTSNGNATLAVSLAYCSSNATNTADEEIFSVTVNGATNAYACGTLAPGAGSILNEYSNFTSLSSLTSIMQGATVPFSIQEDECDGATYYSNGCAIWIDFNQDSDFGDAGEQVFVENSTTAGPRTIAGNISIPVTALAGITRMRIVVVENQSGAGLTPCGTYSYGETEDYLINILGCTPSAPSCATNPSPASGATGQSNCVTTLTWSAPAATGCDAATSYDVYFGTTAVPPFVVNTTSTSYSTGTNLNPSTTYYWKVVPKNAAGSASACPTWSFTTGAIFCLMCDHTIRLTDTYGDGWNGGTVTVTVNGTPVLTNITLAAGAGPQDFTFSAATGFNINVTRTADGSYPSEMRVELISGVGSTLLASTQPVTAPGTTVTGCCTAVVPGVATSPSPANSATGINACSLDISWTAPASGSCNSPTSYDLYLGTAASPPFLPNQTGTSYSLPNALMDNTTYYWKAVPKNGAGPAAACPVWSFTTGTSPSTAYCFYGNTIDYPSAGTGCAQLTSATTTQNGCAWNRSPITFGSAFDYSVNMYFGAAAGGADGCAFVFQNSPQGISQCGQTGYAMGAGGISNSVIIEFDTYDNDGSDNNDLASDHTAVEIDGQLVDDPSTGPANAPPLCGPVQADPLDGLLADGLVHNLRVTWNPASQELCVYVDGSQRISCAYDYVNNVFGGNTSVYWGFTGSTGLLSNQQYFCPINLPLSVQLVDFTASCENGNRVLDWYTASESNSSYFKVERSADGQHFESSGTVAAAGNSNELRHYRWTDPENLKGRFYYRLTQYDYDGQSEQLSTVASECSGEGDDLSIRMALGTNQTVITEFNIAEEGTYTIEVIDLMGRSITRLTSYFASGVNQMDLLAPCLRPGIYVLSIHNETQSAVRKFVAQ
jgi:hypothetical protein